MPFLIVFGVLLLCALTILAISYYCFKRVFYWPDRTPLGEEEFELPPGQICDEHKETMIGWMRETRAMPHEKVSITSFDGLTLRGKYYECKKGAPIELLFHGYQGNSERDLCGGVQRCFSIGRNALLVDHRAGGESDGNVITFGINESKDCLRWIDFVIEKFGKDVKIMLGGISMGASTVLMAAGHELPENVVCVVADCGYSSAKEIIQKIITEMGLPVKWVYPFIKLGARVFGKFNLEETSPVQAMETCKTPVLIFHGTEDDFVPYEMGEKIYTACKCKKRFVGVKGAGHGFAYPTDVEGYLRALTEFEQECYAEKNNE